MAARMQSLRGQRVWSATDHGVVWFRWPRSRVAIGLFRLAGTVAAAAWPPAFGEAVTPLQTIWPSSGLPPPR